MEYRPARPEEIPACNELIASTKYYDPVDLADMGGIVLVAIKDNIIKGCVWAAVSKKFAYGDWLSVAPDMVDSGLGVKLMIKGRALLAELGVTHFTYHIHENNSRMMKIALAFRDTMDLPYIFVSAKLGE